MKLSAPRAELLGWHFINHGCARAACYAACSLYPSSKRLCFLGTEVGFHCGALQERLSEAATVGPRRDCGASRDGLAFERCRLYEPGLPRSGAANQSCPVR